ncbi:MAG: hypothetical protein AAFY71_05290 [Bacteroidota bacterium]
MEELDPLKKIKRVAVPAHLLHNIQQEIEEEGRKEIPMNWAVAACISLVLLCSLNLFVWDAKQRGEREASLKYVETFEVAHSNLLYHE